MDIMYGQFGKWTDHEGRFIDWEELKPRLQVDSGKLWQWSLAETLLGKLVQEYPNRSWEIRVLEDAENGAVIQYADAA